MGTLRCRRQICAGLHVNDMHGPYEKHNNVSSFVKGNHTHVTHDSVKYRVI